MFVNSLVWDLPKYERMHHRLQDVPHSKHRSVQVAIGSKYDEFLVKTDHSIHCPNQNSSLTDEVHEMSHKEVKMVALGLEGCGLILSTDNLLIDHMRIFAQYPTLRSDLKRHHHDPSQTRKPVCFT